MKKNYLFMVVVAVLTLALFTQCEKYGRTGELPGDGTDRPDWAGGDTGDNPHNKKGQGSTTGGSGGDYGDLYELLRDEIGKPVMIGITSEGVESWYVQPVGVDGEALELDGEGEFDGSLAIPVDFGRLNIIRSPQSVLNQALLEALKVLKAADSISLDFCGRVTAWNNGLITKTIDSPRESMALYQEIMNNEFSDSLTCLQGYGFDPLLVAASCFAAGSDKTGTVNVDEVVYLDGFLNCLGCCSIENEHEYLWSTPKDGTTAPLKKYYNFGPCISDCECHCDEDGFQYDRYEVYKNRYVRFIVWDGNYNPESSAIYSIYEIFVDPLFQYKGIGERPEFSKMMKFDDDQYASNFALAVDDAVQVLDFVHGDSNLEFLPNYTE